jgi:hypothetical protein
MLGQLCMAEGRVEPPGAQEASTRMRTSNCVGSLTMLSCCVSCAFSWQHGIDCRGP